VLDSKLRRAALKTTGDFRAIRCPTGRRRDEGASARQRLL